MGNFKPIGVMTAIRRRRSIRAYSDQPVEDEKIQLLLEAARLAPSSSNTQPWHFIIVRQKKLIEKLSECVLRGTKWVNRWMTSAPCVIVACGKPHPIVHLGAKVLGMDLLKIDVAIALEHITLAATELGLGTCWIGWFSERKVKRLLHIPWNVRVVALLTLGYPKNPSTPESIGGKHPTLRKDIKKIYSLDRYQKI